MLLQHLPLYLESITSFIILTKTSHSFSSILITLTKDHLLILFFIIPQWHICFCCLVWSHGAGFYVCVCVWWWHRKPVSPLLASHCGLKLFIVYGYLQKTLQLNVQPLDIFEVHETKLFCVLHEALVSKHTLGSCKTLQPITVHVVNGPDPLTPKHTKHTWGSAWAQCAPLIPRIQDITGPVWFMS